MHSIYIIQGVFLCAQTSTIGKTPLNKSIFKSGKIPKTASFSAESSNLLRKQIGRGETKRQPHGSVRERRPQHPVSRLRQARTVRSRTE